MRAKSKMHHTGGFDTFEEAVADARANLCVKLHLPEKNIALDHAILWNSDKVCFTVCLPNWRRGSRTLDELLAPNVLTDGPLSVDALVPGF